MTLFNDTRHLFVRSLKKLIRNPILIFFSLFQPIIFLLLFTQLFSKFAQAPGLFPAGVSYLAYATPGILLQNGFSSALQSGTSIVDDLNTGFLQKMLVTPVSRSAILLGSSRKPATARRVRKGQKNRSPPAGNWRGLSGSFRGQSVRGAGRENCLLRDAAPGFFGTMVSEAGRWSGFPKKGRGTSDGFGRALGSRLRSKNQVLRRPGRTSKDKRTLGRRSQVEVRAPPRRERFDGKRRLSW